MTLDAKNRLRVTEYLDLDLDREQGCGLQVSLRACDWAGARELQAWLLAL